MARLAEPRRSGLPHGRYRVRRWRQLVYPNTNPDPYSDAHTYPYSYPDDGRHLHHRGDGHARYNDLTRNTDYRDCDSGLLAPRGGAWLTTGLQKVAEKAVQPSFDPTNKRQGKKPPYTLSSRPPRLAVGPERTRIFWLRRTYQRLRVRLCRMRFANTANLDRKSVKAEGRDLQYPFPSLLP